MSRGGVELYGAKAKVSHICVAHADGRDQEWQWYWPLIVVLVHCAAGRHRAAVVAFMIVAIMCRITVGQAHAQVLQRRPIQLEQAFRDDDLSKWAHAVVRHTELLSPWPQSGGWIGNERSHCHIMTCEGVALCAHEQGASQVARLLAPLMTKDPREGAAWCKPFCRECAERALAGFCCDDLSIAPDKIALGFSAPRGLAAVTRNSSCLNFYIHIGF